MPSEQSYPAATRSKRTSRVWSESRARNLSSDCFVLSKCLEEDWPKEHRDAFPCRGCGKTVTLSPTASTIRLTPSRHC